MPCLLCPPLQRSWKGGILVSPCPTVPLWTESCPLCILDNTHRILLILHILSSNFRRCVACNVCFKIQKFIILANSLNLWFNSVFFWLGIQYDLMVWVIMRRRGYPQNAGVLVVLVCMGLWWSELVQLMDHVLIAMDFLCDYNDCNKKAQLINMDISKRFTYTIYTSILGSCDDIEIERCRILLFTFHNINAIIYTALWAELRSILS